MELTLADVAHLIAGNVVDAWKKLFAPALHVLHDFI